VSLNYIFVVISHGASLSHPSQILEHCLEYRINKHIPSTFLGGAASLLSLALASAGDGNYTSDAPCFVFLTLYLYDTERRQWDLLIVGLYFVSVVLNILTVAMAILQTNQRITD
jgi:hypothetical protein